MNTHYSSWLQSHAGPFAILFASVLWGTTGTVANQAQSVSPLAIGAFAMGVSGVLQAIFARQWLRRDWSKLSQHKHLVMIGALGVATYPLAFYTSMHLAGVAIGTVVSIGAAPFSSALLEWFISKKSPFNVRWCISLALGIVGILLLAFSGSSSVSHPHSSQDTLMGILLGLVAASSYALYAWSGALMIEREIHSKSAIGSMFALSACLLLPSLYITGENLFTGLNNSLVALYMAFIPMFLGYVLFGFGLKTTPASTATILTLFEPVVAAIFAVTIVGEQISVWGWFGMGLIGACLLLQTLKTKPSTLVVEPA